jgi:hypothetical protein
VSTPITIVDGNKSTPHIPRRTKFVNLHEDLLREVNKVFASQPLDQGEGVTHSQLLEGLKCELELRDGTRKN